MPRDRIGMGTIGYALALEAAARLNRVTAVSGRRFDEMACRYHFAVLLRFSYDAWAFTWPVGSRSRTS
jgi:hypothetical protein